jgi:hypothetical protein
MKTLITSRDALRRVASALLLLAASTAAVQAQICTGAPANGGVAYQNGAESFGTSHGGAASFTPGRVGLELSGRASTFGDDESGYAGAFRLSIGLGGRLKICPTFGLGGERRTWDINASSQLTTNELSGRGGLGAGYELAIGKSAGVAPFAIVEYVHRVTHLDARIANTEPSNVGVQEGAGEATVGVLARYTRVYAGIALVHPLKDAPTTTRRLFVGVAF